MWMRALLVIAVLGCSDKGRSARPPATPSGSGTGSAPAPTADACATAIDKIFAVIGKRGYETGPEHRQNAIAECKADAGNPLLACVIAANDDAAVEACLRRKPKGEPGDQLDAAAQQLRTYHFIHETFTNELVPLTPAQACCRFPTKKCPPETKPNEILRDILKLDLTTERAFQYRFESHGQKAIIEAVGDRDCDGKTVTYRRELEFRGGAMDIRVTDPPEADD